MGLFTEDPIPTGPSVPVTMDASTKLMLSDMKREIRQIDDKVSEILKRMNTPNPPAKGEP